MSGLKIGPSERLAVTGHYNRFGIRVKSKKTTFSGPSNLKALETSDAGINKERGRRAGG
jgi:hypothetical protein